MPGKKRDVDILLITHEDGTRIRVAYEAKDEKRPTTIERVEQYWGKYFSPKARVPVERLVMVSRNGFTDGAITKASLLGIKLLTLDEAKQFDWAETGWSKAQEFSKITSLKVEFPPHIDRIDIKPQLPAAVKDVVLRCGQMHGPRCKANCMHGTLFAWAEQNILRSAHPEMVAGIEDMKARALTDPNGARLVVDYPLELGETFLRYSGKSFAVESVEVELHTVNGTASATCTPYTMTDDSGDQNFHHLKANLGNFEFQFVLKHGDGPTNIGYKAKNHFQAKSAKPRKNPRERAADRKQQNKAAKKKGGKK